MINVGIGNYLIVVSDTEKNGVRVCPTSAKI